MTTKMPILENILNGTIASDSILIEDTVENDGFPFLFSVTQRITQRVDRVELFCTDSNSESMIEKYKLTQNEKMKIHAVYDDPLHWNDPSNSDLCYETDLNDYLTARKGREGKTELHKTAIVIDSLSVILLNKDLGSVCRMISELKQKGIIVFLLHSDVHDDHVTNSIEFLASTILSLGSTDRNKVSVTHKYSTGKVTKEVMKFTIAHDRFEITELMQSNSVAMTESVVSEPEAHRLASKLTFSVSLKEEEKRSRAKLILPYERVSNDAASTTATTNSGGRIIYEPDKADDFDEEDPDDDLDL